MGERKRLHGAGHTFCELIAEIKRFIYWVLAHLGGAQI